MMQIRSGKQYGYQLHLHQLKWNRQDFQFSQILFHLTQNVQNNEKINDLLVYCILPNLKRETSPFHRVLQSILEIGRVFQQGVLEPFDHKEPGTAGITHKDEPLVCQPILIAVGLASRFHQNTRTATQIISENERKIIAHKRHRNASRLFDKTQF